MVHARLQDTNLSHAELDGAHLNDAKLRDAILYDVDLDLRGARLEGVDLRRADLSSTNLKNARGLTDQQFESVLSLEGATMPNGQKYEDWLKEKEGSGEEQ